MIYIDQGKTKFPQIDVQEGFECKDERYKHKQGFDNTLKSVKRKYICSQQTTKGS